MDMDHLPLLSRRLQRGDRLRLSEVHVLYLLPKTAARIRSIPVAAGSSSGTAVMHIIDNIRPPLVFVTRSTADRCPLP